MRSKVKQFESLESYPIVSKEDEVQDKINSRKEKLGLHATEATDVRNVRNVT